MTIPPNASTLLGFAQKARKLVSGESAVENSIKNGKARLVLMADDMPDKRQLHWLKWCESMEISCLKLGTKGEYGNLLGTSPRGILAITDEQMAQAVKKQLDI